MRIVSRIKISERTAPRSPLVILAIVVIVIGIGLFMMLFTH